MIRKVLASLIMVHLVTIFAKFLLYVTVGFRGNSFKHNKKHSHSDFGGHFFFTSDKFPFSYFEKLSSNHSYQMSFVARKPVFGVSDKARQPVFGVSDKARQKPVSSATQTS